MGGKLESVWISSLSKVILYGLTLVDLVSESGTAIPGVVVFKEIRIVKR